MNSKMYLHVDLDAFFASVEVLDNPDYKGKPLIVGGLPGERRSVVSTCSYEARKYGVHSAMPINRAYELCPHAIFVHGRMERYHEKSQEVMAVFREYSPDVMQMSIDEAFIDITGTELLFGDPLSLAKSLKQKVLERTGLTVSVGIATNRYVAKIASGLKKPDGLCYVPAGEEEKFMLSLPLDKLWGIGTKSRERLNACGIFTIPEIHAISETALKELFGEASGTFLYKSVRGMDVEHFGDETKSRSMSAERTFCFDLSDIFSIETELLHLSYDVMFRVLKAKVNSKTVCLKIRYEDFTTVSVTESSTRIVSSIEDLFERACRLFHKKYERGRGIRLLGLGLQNITDGLESSQGELFDFGEKKQRSVEKTVLTLHQKDPANRLKKARQLITTCLAIFFFASVPHPVCSQSLINELDSESIEFDVEGSWESLLTTDTSVIIGGAAPVLSFKPPVFTQKAELYLWFMYDSHWYFEASAATDSDKNTIAAGYEGDGLIREIRAGTDIGTENMSPGIRISIGGDTWDASAQVHLDAVTSRTKTWKGSSELVSSTIPVSSFKTGFLFALPDSDAALNITGILIEDAKGTWTDGFGRHYRRLSQNEYLILPAKGLIYLETAAKGAVIAETASKPGLESNLTDFLKDTADWFDDRGAESTYTMMGIQCTDEAVGPTADECASLFTTVTNGAVSSDGLYVMKPGTFSPFQVASLYQGLSSTDASLSVSSRFLFADHTSSILLENNNTLIQLHSSESSERSFSSASVRFPAAKKYPWIYLPSSGITHDEAPVITATSSETSDTFTIGSSAIENSIQVLKNGSPVPAKYDRQSGTVSIASGYSEADTITILWNEYSAQSEDMKLTVSADFHADPTPYFTTSASLSSLLSFNSETRQLSSTPGNKPQIAASLTGSWARSFGAFDFAASNTVSSKALLASASQKAPLFTLSGSGTEEVWFMDGAAASDSVPVLKPRYSGLPATLPVLDEADMSDFTISGVRKPNMSGLALTIEGILSENNGSHISWYAADLPLSSGAASLPSAHEFSFKLTDVAETSSDYDVYLKLGECTWLISSSSSVPVCPDVLMPFIPGIHGEQTVKVLLTDADRLKLDDARGMKLVIVNKATVSDTDIKLELSGSLDSLGGISFNMHAENSSGSTISLPVSVTETAFPAPLTESGWFTKAGPAKTACILWNTADAADGDIVVVERSFTGASASGYQKAAVLLYVPSEAAVSDITINLLSAHDAGWAVSETFSISEAELSAAKGDWLILIQPLSTDDVLSKVQIICDAKPSGTDSHEELYIGGIFLLDPLSSLTISDEATASMKWTSGDYSASLSADASGSGTSFPSLSQNLKDNALSSSVHAAFTSPWLSLSGHGSFDLTHSALLSGEYLAATGNRFLFGVLGISDNYRWNANADTEYRKDTLSLSLNPLHIPFNATGTLETDKAGSLITENATMQAACTYSAGETSITFKASQLKAPESTFTCLGSAQAQKRAENASFTQKLSFAEGVFAPVLEIGLGAQKEKEKADNTGSFTQKLTLPFIISTNRISFIYSRETSSEYAASNGQSLYADDIAEYFKAFSTHADALTAVPVYDLFQKDLGSVLSKSLEKADRTSRSTYVTSSTAVWNRPLRADWLDLILPNAASFTATRTLSFAGQNVFDKKLNTLSVSFTAFNVFGAYSASELFDWYDQDEYQYTIKLTAGAEKLKTEITGYSTLYFDNDGSLTTFYSGQITDKELYSHTVQFSWERPAIIFEKAAERVTTGSFGIRRDGAKSPVTSTSLNHKATINVNESFAVTASAVLGANIREMTTLTASLSIGGKLQF